MPDYSGYAQRQQQDPNLAAWSNISGNLANIFGLDPAKAADARRGIQQEDYNEMRNKAYMRQQLANKRIGELMSGSGFDQAKGEFIDPASWREFVSLMGELGDARQAVPYGIDHAESQLNARIASEDRALENRRILASESSAREAAANEAKAKAAYNEKLAKRWSSIDKTGNSRIGVSPDAGIARFNRLLMEGDASSSILPFNQALGFSRVTEATKGLPSDKQVRESSPEFSAWLSKSTFGKKSYPIEIEKRLRASGANLEDEKKAVAAALIRQFRGQISQADVEDITDRIVNSELTLTHEENKGKADPMARISGKDELEKFLISQDALPPEKRSETVMLRIKVPGSLKNDYTYEEYPVSALLDPKNKNNPNHPLFK
jgi:hypothetical protein